MQQEITIIDTKYLAKAAQVEGLPQTTSEELENAFMPFFENAVSLIEKAKKIKVENLNQSKEMGEARATRIALKDIRVSVEHTRKALKENSLRTGRAIDGMANILKLKIEPIEAYLQEQEKYGERLAAKARAAVRSERELQAGKYLPDFPQSVDLGEIDEYEFAKLFKFAQAQFDAREETARRLEAERLEREQKEAQERAEMQAENERLRKENEEREAALKAEREERERAQREHEAKLAAERAENERLRREAEAKEMAERIERERLEKAEAKRLADIEAAKEAARVAAENASDRVKMEALVLEIKSLNIPDFQREGLKRDVLTLLASLESDFMNWVE